MHFAYKYYQFPTDNALADFLSHCTHTPHEDHHDNTHRVTFFIRAPALFLSLALDTFTHKFKEIDFKTYIRSNKQMKVYYITQIIIHKLTTSTSHYKHH